MDIYRKPLAMMLALLVAWSTASSVWASDAESPDARQVWIEGLLQGRDMSAHVAEHQASWRESKSRRLHDGDRSLGRHRDAVARAERDVRLLLRSARPWLAEERIDNARGNALTVLASYKLLVARSQAVLDRTIAEGLAPEIVARAEAAFNTLDEREQSLRVQIEALAEFGPDSVTSIADEREWLAQFRALHRALNTARQESNVRTLKIRRNAIPFGRRLQAPGPVPTGPGMAPSYADSDAIAGQPDDLSATREAPLSEAVLSRAAALDYDYIRIFNFVRQDIRTEYYAGAMKDADTVMATGGGNDVDQASLLIALLRGASAHARYVHGVVELSLEQAGGPLGLSDSDQILEALTRAGIPNEPVIQGGQVVGVRLSQTWVSAYLPYSNYRGAAVDLSGKSWIPLAPAISSHAFDPPALDWMDVGINAETLIADYLGGRIDNDPMFEISSAVETHLVANPTLGSYNDQLTEVRNTAAGYKLLPSSLPFVVSTVVEESPALADSQVQHLHLSIPGNNEAVMDVEVPVSKLLGRRVTLSYVPATTEDYTAIREFGGMALVPPYLIRLRPQLNVDGSPLLSGAGDLAMGEFHVLEVTQSGPAGSYSFERDLLAGTYAALNQGAQLNQPAQEALDDDVLDDREHRAPRLLHNLAARYAADWDQTESELAGLMNVAVVRPLPALAMVSTEYAVERVNGLPLAMRFQSISMDAALRSAEPLSRRQAPTIEYDWLRLTGLQGSYLESEVFQSQWAVESISAEKGLKLLSQQGLPPVLLNPENLAATLGILALPQAVKDHLTEWVNRGYHALAAPQELTLNAWTGSVWHLWHPEQGSGGYFIAGGLAGGETTEPHEDWLLDELTDLGDPYGEGSNLDPLAGVTLLKIHGSDNQIGVVNEMLDRPLATRVVDAAGVPVVGASVRYRLVLGDAELVLDSVPASQHLVQTDERGVALIDLQFGTSTGIQPIFGLEPGQPASAEATRFGEVIVDAAVITSIGELKLDRSLRAYARPGVPVAIEASSNLLSTPFPLGTVDPVVPSQIRLRSSVPEGYAGFISASVTDQFGNYVSNFPLSFTGGVPYWECDSSLPFTPATFFSEETCPTHQLDVANCPSTPNLTLPSKGGAIRVGAINGTGGLFVRYPLTISANGLGSQTFESMVGMFMPITTFGLGDSPAFCDAIADVGDDDFDTRINQESFPRVTDWTWNSGRSQSTEGAKVGEAYSPRQAFAFTYLIIQDTSSPIKHQLTIIPAHGTIQADVEDLGLSAPGVETSPGFYALDLTVGNTPRRHSAQLFVPTITGTVWGFDPGTFEQRTFTFFPGERLWESSPIFAVQARILSVSQEPLKLNAEGYLEEPLLVDYEVTPADYLPLIEISLLEDDQIIDSRSRQNGPNIGQVSIQPDHLFDLDKEYHLEIVLNRDKPGELEFDSFELELTQKIVKSLGGINDPDLTINTPLGGGRIVNNQLPSNLIVSNEIDIPNQLSCERRDANLDLSQDATVSITLDRLDENGVPTGQLTEILNDEFLPEGEHLIELSANELLTANYDMEIRAVSAIDGQEEVILGRVNSSMRLTNTLPVGHPIVKGVDLSDGGGVLSRQDINVPGLGVGLSFVRTYASKSRFQPGVMGVGWNHNYLSRVSETPCGDFIVSGAEGGSMRFVREGEGFRPLKGYHGSLIQNEVGNFDFYPKGGNRYHFIRKQANTWWLIYIEDTNGNRTSLNYEDRPKVPLIKRVTDPSGRQLVFEYEFKTFETFSGEVLTRVEGPGGIQLSLEYDDFGNLVRAARESNAVVEEYEYYTDLPQGNWHLLKTARDGLSGAERHYQYDEQSLVTPIGAFPLDVLAATVRQITEPDNGTTVFGYTPGAWGTFASTTVTDARGNATTYTMNDYGASTQIDAPNGRRSMVWDTTTDVLLTSETDENGRTRSFEYDEHGNVTRESVGTYERSYSYYRPEDFEPPVIKNRVKTYTNWRGDATGYTYDGAGNLKSETLGDITASYHYDSQGLRRSATDGNGNTTIFDYDAHGYQSSQVNALGNEMAMDWDVRGRKRREIDPLGHIVDFDYDDRDRVTEKRYLDVDLGAGGATLTERVVYEDGLRRRTEFDRRGLETVFQHDAMGRLKTITNPTGDSFRYDYDPNGNKTLETDWLGRDTTFAYDGSNRLRTRSEPLGKVTTYGYDDVGNLLSEITTGQGGSREMRYDYEPSRYFQREIRQVGSDFDVVIARTHDGEGNIETETDPMGRQTVFTYDAFNRRKTQSGPMGSGMIWDYDGAGNLRSETTLNDEDQVRTAQFDAANRKISQTDAEGGVTTFDYFADGTLSAQTDARGNRTEYQYNALDLVLSRTQPSDLGPLVTRFEYDENGNLRAEVWPNGNRVVYDYDELNRERSRSDSEGPVAERTYDAVGNVKTETDGNGNTAFYDYNALNQRITETRPLGRNRSFTYTAFGEVNTETDAADNTLTHSIDALGRRRATTGPQNLDLTFDYDAAGNLTVSSDSRGIQSSFGYNDLNQRTSETIEGAGGSFSRSFGYDLLGNRTAETDRRGIASSWAYDKENRLTRYSRDNQQQERREYDSVGNLQFLHDANGNVTAFDYDARNLVKKETRPANLVTSYGLDAMGDVTTEDRPGNRDISRSFDKRRRLRTEINAEGESTTFDYDDNNNQTSRIRPESTEWQFSYDEGNRLKDVRNPLGHTTRYDYDSRDNRTEQIDAKQRPTSFVYDSRNRMRSKTYPGGATVNYDYDANDNLTQVSMPNGNVAGYDYDALNRQDHQTYSGDGGTITVDLTLDGNGNITNVNEFVPGATHQITQDFDGLDRLRRITDRYGNTLQYAYDDNGNRTVLIDHNNQRTDYNYDQVNRLDDVVIPGMGIVDYHYFADGRLQAVDFPNGSRSAYSYDGADRVQTITHTQSGSEVAFFDYDYDANGNRSRMEERNGQGSEITTYGYDDADRLQDVVYPDVSVHYVLDEVGNRSTETATGAENFTRNYGYNARDQLSQVDDTAGLLITYGYDASGNQIEKIENGQTTTFDYSPRDRLVTVTLQGAPPVAFEYDYRGFRVRKEANGNATRHIYDDQALIAETNVLGNTLARYHYGSDRRLAETRATANTYFLQDGLGTPVALTAQDGTIQARYTYDAWGNLKREQGGSEQPFGFTGYQKDEETDLYYAQQRYYDSFTGRFLREDPFVGDVNTPPSLHRYLYAYANPTVYFDPTGTVTEEQYAHRISIAIAEWEQAGNRTSLGTAGELKLERLLERSGHVIVKGPATNPGQHNADIVAYDPEEKRLRFFDNKIQQGKAAVSSAANLSESDRRLRSIDEARDLVKNLELDGDIRMDIGEALDIVEADSTRGDWLVANSNPDPARVNNVVKRLSVRLAKKGVRFANVRKGNVEVRDLQGSIEGARGSKKFLAKAGSALPVVGVVVSGSLASMRMAQAAADDREYREEVAESGGPLLYAHHSTIREATIIAAEEAGGEALGALGAAAGASCNVFAWACVPAGGFIGGFAGDFIGGGFAEWQFDRNARLSESEIAIMLENERTRLRNAPDVITEKDDEP